ncbi:hypothetical protein GCM10011380_02770 [Sphingomonas metalli]|uniref:Acyltransferase 3 domain-containing protein n=1 Tax=Sphingomonas metalli TaxID=1779358 RepID=A0A916SWD2_9SPHN|nr:hypothetical protein GCM10011380_02770 [Sphingomonas metalli]
MAALIVVIYHCALYYDYGAAARFWVTTVFNAHAAVVSFFVLSGFVLTLSLIKSDLDARAILCFYVRRAFRIYPALWAACGLGVAYLLIFGAGGTELGTDWARQNFGGWPMPGGKLVAAFAGLKPNLPLPIWTMAVELAGSLLLPFLVVAMRRSVFVFAILLLALGLLSCRATGWPLWIPTYLVDFGIGAAVALAIPHLRAALSHRSFALSVVIAGFGLLWFGRILTGADYVLAYNDPLTALIEAFGAAIMIAAIHVRPAAVPALSAPAAIVLGNRSYSLYLLHQPVLGIATALVAIVAPRFVMGSPGTATLAVLMATLMATMPLAAWSFRHVEVPAMRMGRRIGRVLERSPATSSRCMSSSLQASGG